ncbi:MAG: ATP-binding protein [Bacteroidetes bacterium]|nr:ATP-binding protein [Bacteroidota bacterium]
MHRTYIQRSLDPVIVQAAAEFPAVVLTGPRQSGKTTLLKHLFGDRYKYISVELPDVRTSAIVDPRGFLEQYHPPVIIDEIQHAPDLLPYIKEKIDNNRNRAGQFLLTGSQNIHLSEKVTESLAGRVALLRLLPLSRREEYRTPQKLPIWDHKHIPESKNLLGLDELWQSFLRGGYPELVTIPHRDTFLWHSSYIQTYLERDVRSLRQVGDLTQYQIFLRALAARSGQLLNMTNLSRDLGVAVNTIKAWLSILESTYQIMVLRPYHKNIGKRLVKTPKVFFSDVGTLCHLVGLKDPEHAAAGPMGGTIFETAVLSEIFRTLTHMGIQPQIYFWRTFAGSEVDFLVSTQEGLIPIEVKLSATPNPSMASRIHMLQKDLGESILPGYIVHPGDIRLPLGEGVTAIPFADL